MIRPTNSELLAGVAEALKTSVLPELARGTAARKQLQAAIEILRRVAFALPSEAAVLEADNADMAEILRRASELLEHSPTPKASSIGEADEAAALLNTELQARLAALQNSRVLLPAEIEAMLAALYNRMTDRALGQLPPPVPRGPRKPE